MAVSEHKAADISDESVKQLVKESGKAWIDWLSESERQAVIAYTGMAYKRINEILRGIEDTITEYDQNIAVDIFSALDKSSIPVDCTVYRGASIQALGEYGNLNDEDLVGKVIYDEGFMSTSLSEKDAFSGDVQLEILVPKGAKGAYVGYISQLGHTESEVLFNAGQMMQIIGVTRDIFGNRKIRVRILGGE